VDHLPARIERSLSAVFKFQAMLCLCHSALSVQVTCMAVFTSEIIGGNISVALSLLFSKIYPTMN
jgi:hypothetical protein